MRPRTCECGVCRKCKHREYMRLVWQKAHPNYAKDSVARRRARDVEALRAYDRAEYYRNKEQHRARLALGRAVRSGKIERGSCEVCGEPDAQGHHDDYSKPLEVRWFCWRHHVEHHNALREDLG